MVLDYNIKKGPRESIDRNPVERKSVERKPVERKPVQKNRPRKEPIALFALMSVLALLFTFGAGVLTGWICFRGPRKPLPVAVAAQVSKELPAPAPGQPLPAGPDAPLTFYKTLPAGGKGMIGSGLNLKRPEPAPVAPSVAPRVAPVVAPSAPVEADAEEETQEGPARFVVQIASYRDKGEAETAQVKLAGKGIAAYLVESKLADNGVWYRIRVGRHLTKTRAEELAVKTGKGAIVLTE